MILKKYIPDFITSLNLACGVIGVVFAFKGRIDIAFPIMLAGAAFDFMDGFFARLLKAYSAMGKELDSLADVVTFGVLPAVMLFNLMKACTFSESVICFIPLVLAVFSGLRLAKFNVDERQEEGFLGLPTPAAALLSASLCYYIACEPSSLLATWAAGPIFIPTLSIVLSALLVCEIPMFSFKFHKDDPKVLKIKRLAFAVCVAAIAAVCVVFGFNWALAVFATFIIYIVKNIIYAIVRI